jgi:hypothetical protein
MGSWGGNGIGWESSWDVQDEFAAVTGFALDGDPASVGLDDVPNDGEADADAGGFAAELGAASIERFEDLLVFGRPGCLHRNRGPRCEKVWRGRYGPGGAPCRFLNQRIERQADFDGAMGWRMFDGVVDEIDERLLDRPTIQTG